jgi:tetraacyldisaccharide 4'-kinase
MDVKVMHLVATALRSLDDKSECSAGDFTSRVQGRAVHAVAAIGNPERFFRTLQTLGIEAQSHRFADHHAFTRGDFDSISKDSAFIMTEKDAVKCRSLGLENAWYVPVEARLTAEFEQTFKNRLAKLIKDSE